MIQPPPLPTVQTDRELARGWHVILCCMLGTALGANAITVYTNGIFTPALAKAFHWTYADIQGTQFFSNLAMVAAIPFVGTISDRFGPRPVVLTCLLTFPFLFAAMSLMTGAIWQFYLLTVLSVVAGVGTLAFTFNRVIAVWFHRRRGLAMGLTLLGTGLAGAFLKPYTAWLIGAYGWRGAYVGVAILPLAVATPLCWAWLRSPAAPLTHAVAAAESEDGMSVREALGDWRFWVLGCAYLPISFTIGGLIANLETMLKLDGVSAHATVVVTTCIGLSVMVARPLGGWCLDRVRASAFGAAVVGCLALACMLQVVMAGAAPTVRGLMTAALIGIGSGVEYDVLGFLTAQLFGLRAYSRLYGAMLMFYFAGGAAGPAALGAVYDHFGTYRPALFAAAIGLAAAAAMLLSLGEGRYRAAHRHGLAG